LFSYLSDLGYIWVRYALVQKEPTKKDNPIFKNQCQAVFQKWMDGALACRRMQMLRTKKRIIESEFAEADL